MVSILCIMFFPTIAFCDIDVEYNSNAQIIGAHYSTSTKSSAIIIDIDLKFDDGRVVKCVDNIVTAASFLGMSRWDLPVQINYIPNPKIRCMKIKD